MKFHLKKKYSKFDLDFENAIKYGQKCLVFKTNAFEFLAVNTPYYGENL